MAAYGPKLKELRNRAGYSMADFARAMGYKGESGYQGLEKTDRSKRQHMPFDKLVAIIPLLRERGIPDAEIAELAAPWQLLQLGLDPDAEPPAEGSDPGGEAAQRLRISSVTPVSASPQDHTQLLSLAESIPGLLRAGKLAMASQLVAELGAGLQSLLKSDRRRHRGGESSGSPE